MKAFIATLCIFYFCGNEYNLEHFKLNFIEPESLGPLIR